MKNKKSKYNFNSLLPIPPYRLPPRKRSPIPTPYSPLPLFILCVLCGLLFSCLSVAESAGKLLDGSNEKITEHYRNENKNINVYKVLNRNKEESILIVLNNYPMLKFRASLPDEENIIHFVSLEYLAGSNQGWNEYSLAVIGNGTLVADNEAVLSVNVKIEPVQITGGRIQRRDTRLTGEEAVTALRNRHERVKSLIGWMVSLDDPFNALKGQSISDFKKYWEPVLLPELVLRSRRPDNWLHEGDVFQRAEDIRWNTGYTERVFPEELRPIRDSGTLLRDWEEALSWIYLEYEWEHIESLLESDIKLTRVR